MTIAEELEKKGIEKGLQEGLEKGLEEGEIRTKSALSELIKRLRNKFNNSDEVLNYIDEFILTFNYDNLEQYEEALEEAKTLEEFKRMI